MINENDFMSVYEIVIYIYFFGSWFYFFIVLTIYHIMMIKKARRLGLSVLDFIASVTSLQNDGKYKEEFQFHKKMIMTPGMYFFGGFIFLFFFVVLVMVLDKYVIKIFA